MKPAVHHSCVENCKGTRASFISVCYQLGIYLIAFEQCVDRESCRYSGQIRLVVAIHKQECRNLKPIFGLIGSCRKILSRGESEITLLHLFHIGEPPRLPALLRETDFLKPVKCRLPHLL